MAGGGKYRSCIYSLFDLLLWFKTFIDEHPDREANKLLWSRVEDQNVDGFKAMTYHGGIQRIADNGYGQFKSTEYVGSLPIKPEIVKELALRVNDKVIVTTFLLSSGKIGTKDVKREE